MFIANSDCPAKSLLPTFAFPAVLAWNGERIGVRQRHVVRPNKTRIPEQSSESAQYHLHDRGSNRNCPASKASSERTSTADCLQCGCGLTNNVQSRREAGTHPGGGMACACLVRFGNVKLLMARLYNRLFGVVHPTFTLLSGAPPFASCRVRFC